GGADVLHRLSRDGVGNEPANQQARDGGITIGEMDGRSAAGADLAAVMSAGQVREESVRARFEAHAAESGQAVLPPEQRRITIDADDEAAGALIAEEPDDLLVDFDEVEEEVLIAHLREADFLLGRP